jgi:putative endonuclease
VSSEVETRCHPEAPLDFILDRRHPPVMAFWVYMLRCRDGRYYTGHTDNLERRIAQHMHGGYCAFTSPRRPVRLVWQEQFPTRIDAISAERQVGRWSRAKKEGLIRGDWQSVSFFARPPAERFSISLETNGVGEKVTPHQSAGGSGDRR